MSKNFKRLVFQIKNAWGKYPICNKRPERAPHIAGFCFPLCWRCLSIAFGIIISTILICLIKIEKDMIHILTLCILCIPCLIDGLLQYKTTYLSSNFKRCVTGLLAGFGIRFIMFFIIKI